MKPNMLKKMECRLLVAAGAAGLVGCNTDQGGKKDAGAAALTEAEVPTDTENFDTGLTARSLSLVQADVDQSMGDVISPISEPCTFWMATTTLSTKIGQITRMAAQPACLLTKLTA